jgi:cysteine desulfurase
MKKKIYFDHGATTPVDPLVLEEMMPYFNEKYGNASSPHTVGAQARKAVEFAREQIAQAINVDPEEIYFTSGGTESNNLALRGVAQALKEKGNHIIVSPVEHPCIMNVANFLSTQGFEVSFLPVDKTGLVNPADLKKMMTDKTILVSVMAANHEIGTIQPVKELAEICREKNVYFHSDAVQALGKMPLDVQDLNIDLMTLSAHKIYGPKGIGVLFIKKGTTIEPLLFGGGQEKQLRSGTENVPAIVGFGKAAELAVQRLGENQRLQELRDKLIEGVLENIEGCHLNGHPEKRMPSNANFSFKFIEGESLLMLLDDKGVEVSTGSACSSKDLKPSHILTAIGLTPVQAHGSLRLTLGRDNTEEEVDYFLDVLPDCVKKLRDMSTLR